MTPAPGNPAPQQPDTPDFEQAARHDRPDLVPEPPMGATVYAFVSLDLVGLVLHRMEYRDDIMVLGRGRCTRRGYEMWKLRSDSFPRQWDRGAVMIYMHKDDNGIDIEPIVKSAGEDLGKEYRGCEDHPGEPFRGRG